MNWSSVLPVFSHHLMILLYMLPISGSCAPIHILVYSIICESPTGRAARRGKLGTQVPLPRPVRSKKGGGGWQQTKDLHISPVFTLSNC